jgi:hypothetical protein
MKSARTLYLRLGLALLSTWIMGSGPAIAAITNTISIESSSHTENVSSTKSDINLSWDAAASDVGGDITYEYVLNQTVSMDHASFTTDLASTNTSTLTTGTLTNAVTKTFSSVVDGTFHFHLRAYDSEGIPEGTDVLSFGPIVLDSTPTLAVSPVGPATGDHTSANTVTITGSKFITGASVELVNGTRGETSLSDVTLTGVTVSDANTITATIPVDTVPGTYDLRVTNAAPHEQQVSSVDAYTSTNQIPVADAGENQTLTLSGGSVTLNLDGSGSSDPDGGDVIATYSWTTVTDPSGGLNSSYSGATPSAIVLNTAGTYEFSLIVNDGFHNSTADIVQVTVSSTDNNPPTANAGIDQSIDLGTEVTLNGSQSDDQDDDGLTYSWTFSDKPLASSLESADINQTDNTVATATFTPDVVGDYTISLIVNDGTVDSTADTMVVTVGGVDTIEAIPYDINGDGMSDIVIRHTSGNTWKYLMNGHTIDSMAPIAAIDPVFDIVGVADMTGDQKADIVLKSDSLEMIWYADGVTNEMSLMVMGLPTEWPVAAVADFNGDGTNDVLIQNTTTGVLWLYNVENGAIVENGNFIGGLEPGWSVVGAGDINGDGMSDIVIRHTSGDTWKYLMDGHIIDSMAPIAAIDPVFDIVGVADITGDAKADIVIKSHSLEMIWYADGVTNAMTQIVGSLPTEWPVAAVADFTGDGTNDILIQNTTTGVLWLYNVESGAIVENGNFIGGLESGWTTQYIIEP